MSDIVLRELDEHPQELIIAWLANEVILQYRAAATKVALNHGKSADYPVANAPDSIEKILQMRFAELPKEKRDLAGQRAEQVLGAKKSSVRSRWLGGLEAADFAQPARIDELQEKVRRGSWTTWTQAPQLVRSFKTLLRRDLGGVAPSEAAAATTIAPIKKLALRITRVKCLEETDGVWPFPGVGSDEIKLGGIAMSPNGDVSKVSPFMVGNFDTGEEKVYDAPAKEFKTFAISAGDDLWPKAFVTQLVLAEADNGGINGFINALVDGVESKIASILAAMATAAAAGAIGGMVGGVVGAIVGAAVGAAVAGIVAWLKIAWSDDIFDPRTSTVIVPTPDARFGDDLESSTQTVTFSGHGGRYRLKYKWILTL